MGSPEILNVVGTVFVVQLICDFIAVRMVFRQDSYARAVASHRRAQVKLTKLNGSGKEMKTDKQLKKLQRAKDDVGEAAAVIAKKHSAPALYNGIVFLVLFRILQSEYQSKVIAILPFVPFKILRYMSMRGLTFDEDAIELPAEGPVTSVQQACNFLFIYVLATLSVKFLISHCLITKPPQGADGGIMTIMDSPGSQKMLRAWGLDPDILKDEE